MKTIQFELNSLRYKQQLLAILMFGLVTVVVWITISLASSQTTSKITPAQTQAAKSLNPNINQDLLRIVEEKRQYSAQELQQFTIYRIVSDQEVRERGRGTTVLGPSLSSELGLLAPVTTTIATPAADLSASSSSPVSDVLTDQPNDQLAE